MEKATRITGHVVDDAGHPIPGASVFIEVTKKYPGSDQRIDLNWHPSQTDAQGLFTFTGLPADPDKVDLGTYDLMHLNAEFLQLQPYSPRQALWDGTAKLTLPTGTPVDVTVLKPDGTPAPGAEVFVGRDNHVVNCLDPVAADANGVVRLAAKPGFSSTLTASLKGYGPAQSPLAVSSAPQHLTLKLTPPNHRSIDVVDSAGRPIPNVEIRPSTWRGTQVLSAHLRTDAAGHAVWNGGPADPVLTDILPENYVGKRDFPWSPNTPARVVLVRPTPVTATVVDATTNQPIPDFTVRPAVVWNEGERLIWQPNDLLNGRLQQSPGQFRLKLDYPAARYLLRVSSAGHLPEDIGPFPPDGTPKTVNLRLQPAPSITGQVLTPDDRPVPIADVYLVVASDWMGLDNGRPRMENSGAHTRTDPDGHFSLPPQREDFALLVLSDQGTATLKRQDLTTPDAAIHLIPWATVHGTIDVQGKPAGNLPIYAQANTTTLADGKPVIARKYFFTTAKDGTFTLPRVPTGRLILTREVPNHSPGRIWFVALGTVDAKPGQDVELHLGQGTAITGQLLIPPGKPWMIRQARLEPKGKPHVEGFENVEIFDDGRFRADGLQPGDYTLHVALHEPPPDNACGWGRVVGEYGASVTVPPNTPLTNVGPIAPNPTAGPDLKPGDPAPDFSVQTLDGQTLRLSDLKGKVVLLDYWATWCAPCIAELPNMKKLAAAHANDPNFVMLSLSIDDTADDPRRFAKDEEIPWPQVWAGIDSQIVRTYGATAVPVTFLIGPDGRILSRDLRGEQLQSAVDAALKSAATSR
jgi:peroxiredoxin